MRRKLAYSNPVLTNSTAKLGSLPQGDWHVSKTGGKLFVGDTNWTRYAILGETVNEADFHLDKTTDMLVQAQDKTTCMDIAIESKPAYDIFVVGGGGFQASSPRRPRPISPRFGGGRVRIRNLYNPPTLKDYPANVPWTPEGTTSTGEKTTDGWKVTVTGSATGWLYPPQQPDGCKCVCWQRQDGTYWKNINDGVTMQVTQAESPIVVTRVCGYTNGNLPDLLDKIGLPLVFAASDHPY